MNTTPTTAPAVTAADLARLVLTQTAEVERARQAHYALPVGSTDRRPWEAMLNHLFVLRGAAERLAELTLADAG